MQRRMVLLLFSSLMMVSVCGFGFERYVAGVHYTITKSIEAPSDPGKVLVKEFFSYGCPHCASIAPAVSVLHSDLPDYVKWERYPALWNERYVFYASAYKALQALGLADKYHIKIFAGIHTSKSLTHSVDSFVNWLVGQGEDKKSLVTVFENTKRLSNQLISIHAMYQKFGITEVPAFIVDGRYATSLRYVKDQAELMEVLAFLVEKAALERKDVSG